MSALALDWGCVPPPDDIPGPNKNVAIWARRILDNARRRSGGRLSQETFGEQIGLSRNGFNKVLNGHSSLDATTRRKLTLAAPLELKGGPETIVVGESGMVESLTKQAYVSPAGGSAAGGYVESNQSRIVGYELDKIEDESERTDAMLRALDAIRDPRPLGVDKRPDRPQRK